MAADDAAEESAMGEVIEAAMSAVALAGAVKQRQVLRRAGLQKAAFERGGEHLGMTRADKATDADGGPAGNGGDGLIGG